MDCNGNAHTNNPFVIDKKKNYSDSRCFSMCNSHPAILNLQLYEETDSKSFLKKAKKLKPWFVNNRHHLFSNSWQWNASTTVPRKNWSRSHNWPTTHHSFWPDLFWFPNILYMGHKKENVVLKEKPKTSDCIGHIYAAHPTSGKDFTSECCYAKFRGQHPFKHSEQ